MARVTVEDCVDKVSNRFDLVMLASQRARNLSAGEELTLERDNDKNPVVALREIAEETVNLKDLQEDLVKSLQNYVDMDEPEEDEMDLLAIHRDMSDDVDSPLKGVERTAAKIEPRTGPMQGIQPNPKAIPTRNGKAKLLLY